MMTPNKLGPAALRRWYWVWLIGGIIGSVACVHTLFFTAKGRSDPDSYFYFLSPVIWFGFAAYCTRRLKHLAKKPSKGNEDKPVG